MNKNIKIITYGNFPYGGASANYNRYLSLALGINNDVEVLIPSGYFYGKSKNINRKSYVENVKYKYLGFLNHPVNFFGKIIDNTLSYLLIFTHLFVSLLNKKTDVVILYNIFVTQSIPLLLLRFVFRKPLIVILPEFYEKPKAFVAKIKWYNFYLGINYLIKYFDGAIVLSEYLNKWVKQKKNVKTIIIPNFIDSSIYRYVQYKPFKKDTINIGYCGTPTKKDGVFDLIRSFSIINKKFPNTHLLIIGDITNGKTLIPALKKIAEEERVLHDVTFTGLVSFSEIPKLLNSCDILALTRPSGRFAEAGFPTKLGEYFACKKPVVVTKVGDIPKYFKNKEHVMLVEPENISGIVNGFESLILDKNLGVKIAENAYMWMENHLNYRNLSMKLDEFLNNIIGVL